MKLKSKNGKVSAHFVAISGGTAEYNHQESKANIKKVF